MQGFGAFGDKILCFDINQRDHGTLGIEPPGDELSMCGEDRVWQLSVSSWRPEVLVKLPCSSAIEGSVALQRDRGPFLGQHVLWSSNEDL